MRNQRIGTISLTVADRARTMVMDGLDARDRPTAVGYFVLDTLRTLFQTGVKPTDEIRIHVGIMSPAELKELSQSVDVFTCTPGMVSWLGDLYKLMVGVSRGDDADER